MYNPQLHVNYPEASLWYTIPPLTAPEISRYWLGTYIECSCVQFTVFLYLLLLFYYYNCIIWLYIFQHLMMTIDIVESLWIKDENPSCVGVHPPEQ